MSHKQNDKWNENLKELKEEKCTCTVGYGWKNFRCLKCGGDIRGVWGLESITKKQLRK